MNPIVFALRRPVTVIMLVVALGAGGIYSIFRMQKDIFPSLNQPVLYVIHNYGGMDPKQIEGLITNQYELLFQYINNVEHVESRSIQSLVSFSWTLFWDRRCLRLSNRTWSSGWSWLKQEKTTVSLPVAGSRCVWRHWAQISFIMHCIGELMLPMAW